MISAVLTGDLVKSSDLNDVALAQARTTVLDTAQEIAGWGANLVGSSPEFFRGDSWQMVLLKPRFLLRSAIFLRARLRASYGDWDTRIAIALGSVRRIDRHRTSLSTGEAFTLSGQTLDAMGSSTDIVVAFAPGLAGPGGLIPLAHLCSVMIDDWSQKQAAVAALALVPNPPTQSEMAERLGVTQQAVSKALSAGKVAALLQAITYCEGLDWKKIVRWV